MITEVIYLYCMPYVPVICRRAAMKENHFRILCSVVKTDIVYESSAGDLIAFFDSTDTSPLMHSADLRALLRAGTLSQSAPFLHQGAEDCYFAGLRADDGILYLGPMCHQRLSVTGLRRLYRYYGIESSDLRLLPAFSLPEMRNIILLTNSMLENRSLENEELIQLNRIINQSETGLGRDHMQFWLGNNESEDEIMYKHTYQEEQLVVQAIKDGNAEEAIRISESMDRDSGRLGADDLQHRKLNAVVGITVCSRAAIEGGVSPAAAYELSGFYISKSNAAQDPAHILHYRNRAIEDLAGRVKEAKEKQRTSGYVKRCMYYVDKNFRYKIYLEDIADSLNISPSYLSRLFHSETGEKLQDYISRIRVEKSQNLLLYSDMSLSEISEYVGFPNQSYYGKMFRKYMSTTPRLYRDLYRAAESDRG